MSTLVGCGDSNTETKTITETERKTEVAPEVETEPQVIDLTVDVIEQMKDGKVTFEVKTNLPDGTTGMIGLSNKAIDYNASNPIVINNGVGVTEPFSYKGEPFVSGMYEVSFSTPLAQLQPESVQKIIGKDYSNVDSEYLLTDGIGSNINYIKEIEIKGSDVTEKDVVNQNESQKEVLKELYSSVNTEYANQKDNFDAPSWAKSGREFNPKVDALTDEIKDMNLSIALGDIRQLRSEYGKMLQGRKGDPEYFKEQIEETLN